MQYFAQDEANRLDPDRSVYETMEAESSIAMVPMIRNILGGFLFAGDDIHKRAGVLSGGERTRLAVARMLLTPANTLLLDEPTNHLDLDSKDVLLEALEDFGGTLIFVSHDRYFVDRLATKVIEIGGGGALVYPGNYEEFLWSRKQQETAAAAAAPPRVKAAPVRAAQAEARDPQASYEERRRTEAEARRRRKADDLRRKRIDELEARIAEREQAIKEIESSMSSPGFYDNREAARPVIDRHQALMWEVGDLMNQWEALQTKS
jgi:ATP-binding cassette subfamily F protein 3